MKLKANDKVVVLSGKDKGKEGKIIQVFPKEGKVVVEGLNIIKKHLRAKSKTEKGQVLELAAPFAVGKAMLLCTKCGKPTRVAYKADGEVKKRACRQCNQFID